MTTGKLAPPLDNPVWSALTGTQAAFARRRPGAARYQVDVSPFSAVQDANDPAAWEDLALLLEPGEHAVLTGSEVAAPPGWVEGFRLDGVQMVATGSEPGSGPGPERGVDIVDLGDDDVTDMLALVARTRPGPFEARTHQLGPYVGVRDHGELVAMAGTRMHPAPYREISAVCTHPDHQGRGLAGLLMRALLRRIADEGEVAVLHAAASNTGAIRLYETLGFETRRPVVFVDVAPAIS